MVPDNSGAVVPVPGWTPSGDFTAVTYGATEGSFPSTTDPGPLNRGANFFAGGPNAATSTGVQIVTLPLIPAGSTYEVCGWFGGFEGQNDAAVLQGSIQDVDGVELSEFTIGGFSAADRGDMTALLFDEGSGPMPTLAKKVVLTIMMSRTDGTYNDGYADSLDFSIGVPPIITLKPHRAPRHR